METNINFDKIHQKRKNFIKENLNRDHVVINGKTSVVLSAPHGVSQVRLGMYKAREIGSLATVLYLQNVTNSYVIAKTRNNNDDANFDEKSDYKDSLRKIIKENKINYLLDFHGMAAKRDFDVNLGVHIGENIATNERIFDSLCDKLKSNGFSVVIDQPFMACSRTISGTMKDEFVDLWTLQIEINCAITNKRQNFEKYKKLLKIFEDWINSL